MANSTKKLSSKTVKLIFDELVHTMDMIGETIRNSGAIDMAVFKANQERNIHDQAAVAMYEIAQNHPFSDGNKREAYLVASYILWEKGLKVKANYQSTFKLLRKIAMRRANVDEVKNGSENIQLVFSQQFK